MKKFTALAVVIILIISNYLFIIDLKTEGAVLDHLTTDTNVVKENILEMPKSSKYYLGNISLRKGVSIYDAYFNLTSKPNKNGEYASEVSLNVGDDDDYEYEFKGKGYGSMGKQSVFIDDAQSTECIFESGDSNDTIEFLLPKQATVQSTELQLTPNLAHKGSLNLIDPTKLWMSDVFPADINGDGNTDVIAAGRNMISWYNNTNGDGTSWSETSINNSHLYVVEINACDIDNDNDIDIIAGARNGQHGYGQVNCYINMDGKGQKWNISVLNSTFHGCYDIVTADMDSDNDIDVVATSSSGWGGYGVFWFNNTYGNGTAWEQIAISDNLSYARGLVVADIDGDGDNDTVAGSYSYPNNDIVWFENLYGNGTTWSLPHLLSRKIIFGFQIKNLVAGDIDNDGHIDIAAAWMRGVYWYWHPSDPKRTWAEYHVGSFDVNSGENDLALIDFSNPLLKPDGYLDIATVSCYITGKVQIWFNDCKPRHHNWDFFYVAQNHRYSNKVYTAKIDRDEYFDLVVGAIGYGTDQISWYKLNSTYPTNVKLDVGADSSYEWTYSAGWFDSPVTLTGLAPALNSLLSSKPIFKTDVYGNDFVKIELMLSTATPGSISFSNLSVEYKYTIRVTGLTGKSLAAELSQHTSMSGSGNDTIPIIIETKSAGKLIINNITIIYNDYPDSTVMDGYGIDEDTSNDALIDLSKHFSDDFLDSKYLIYELVSYSQKSKIIVFVNNGYYLGVDAETGPDNDNWNGFTTVVVKATDDAGLETESKPFDITILPVNDEPILGSKKLPDITLLEGGVSPKLDLDDGSFFVDIDSAELYFNYIVDPLSETDDEQLDVNIDSVTKELYLEAKGNWSTPDLERTRVRIFCDDDPIDITNSSTFYDIFITVTNIDDDPPRWMPIEDITINEEELLENALNLEDYVYDIDNALEDITFDLVSISESYVHVDIDSMGNVNIWADEDYFGTVTAEISASDGTNLGTTTFNITVLNINDPPEVKLLSPKNGEVVFSSSLELKWLGLDPDSKDTQELSYIIYLDTTSGFTLYGNYSAYKETSLTISGLEDKTTYYWNVIPHDGIFKGNCTSIPNPAKFIVDIEAKPRCVLKSPVDNAVINTNHITLLWEGYVSEGATITYDVYLSDQMIGQSYPASALVAERTAKTKFVAKNLVPHQIYYWTVIPRNGDIVGNCTSGVRTFKYDPSIIGYDLNIEAPSLIKIIFGKPYSAIIRIENKGINPDILIPEVDGDILRFYTELEGAKEDHYIAAQDFLELKLNFSDNIYMGTYFITINVKSLGNGITEMANITVTVHEKREEALSSSLIYYLAIAPIIIIVIILIIMLLFKRSKRIDEEMKRVESEILGTIPQRKVMEPSGVRYMLGPGIKPDEPSADHRKQLPPADIKEDIDKTALEKPEIYPKEDFEKPEDSESPKDKIKDEERMEEGEEQPL
jgi:hypothetical protein